MIRTCQLSAAVESNTHDSRPLLPRTGHVLDIVLAPSTARSAPPCLGNGQSRVPRNQRPPRPFLCICGGLLALAELNVGAVACKVGSAEAPHCTHPDVDVNCAQITRPNSDCAPATATHSLLGATGADATPRPDRIQIPDQLTRTAPSDHSKAHGGPPRIFCLKSLLLFPELPRAIGRQLKFSLDCGKSVQHGFSCVWCAIARVRQGQPGPRILKADGRDHTSSAPPGATRALKIGSSSSRSREYSS